ncbi:DUF4870 domain-containing protein [Natronolimnohabitans innermongolicus]|uniref:Putative zinc-ribbon domain-containing protein n=1 Tax=Natronolimnohabitans innermongolicus JCM 12255 TaxID=1227499 RepID=L9X5L2_9EURY|nr:DUF4870 domain-containing protein [Natronolimnohabitans innermongolicus]ELY55878.1 hypothetical protein C493_10383 [Natronolimnohabitans innermongolicus JCM 12255]
MSNYCEYCGASLEPRANFCSECGEPVTADEWGARSRSAGAETRTHARSAEAERKNGTTLAGITHALALFTWVFGPLIVLVVTDDEFAAENAKNAVNWQLMLTIYLLVSMLLTAVLVGFVFLFVLPILNIVVCVVAAIKALDGDAWTYPATPRLL